MKVLKIIARIMFGIKLIDEWTFEEVNNFSQLISFVSKNGIRRFMICIQKKKLMHCVHI